MYNMYEIKTRTKIRAICLLYAINTLPSHLDGGRLDI